MKRFTFESPSYSRTMLPYYDFLVPSIKSCENFAQFINVRKAEVKRTIDVDSAVEYKKDKSYIAWTPMFTEVWNNGLIETTIVLGSLDHIEIWFKAKIHSNTGKKIKVNKELCQPRSTSVALNLTEYCAIHNSEDYDPDLFHISPGSNIGKDLVNKQDQIETILKQSKSEIINIFDDMLDSLTSSVSILTDYTYEN